MGVCPRGLKGGSDSIIVKGKRDECKNGSDIYKYVEWGEKGIEKNNYRMKVIEDEFVSEKELEGWD